MLRTVKIAISLPGEDFAKIERMRKKMGLQRSAIIDKAIRWWLKSVEMKKKITQYEEGYRDNPESAEDIKAMEKASAEAFEEEGWK
ncbi:hypothetical protein KJ662_05460 [Patescibacteria group bacterium]|nr:hypothetical protein [Candidatus Omnitrophota bacterium]MBU1128904.1 hypothetical protein [Candidatus Omnitrophota bacterium]MBU1685667.1 hypothetical protein [Patescibacteria group bacterium]MBU1784204.1 hypothetical protein [Candidatus Omnitrophota bacterium]MBU1852029.1 hypothetical protein [Candidatus Omnitrophota bacterium]